MRRTAYDIAKTAMMLSLALVLSILEAWLLPRGILPIPGFKLGLANIAILVTLYGVGKKEAFLVAVLRSLVILGLGGNIIGFLFSLLGGIFAWCTMCLLAPEFLHGLEASSARVTLDRECDQIEY